MNLFKRINKFCMDTFEFRVGGVKNAGARYFDLVWVSRTFVRDVTRLWQKHGCVTSETLEEDLPLNSRERSCSGSGRLRFKGFLP